MKNSNIYKELHILSISFKSEHIINSFLKQFDKSEVKILESILETEQLKPIHQDSIEFKLDHLIFNENLNLKDKAIYKIDLIKQITNRSTTKVNHQEAFGVLHDKINENVSKLNETQMEVLDLFVENDNQKINNFYGNLISEVETIVENNIINTDSSEVIKRLVEVKKKLNQLKSQTPNINEVEKIISLKESFT
jgi:hypothetical protein